MARRSLKSVRTLLQKDFSKEVSQEILDLMDTLRQEPGMTIEKMEKKVIQFIMDNIKKDVSAAVTDEDDIIREPRNPPIIRIPGSKPKSKK